MSHNYMNYVTDSSGVMFDLKKNSYLLQEFLEILKGYIMQYTTYTI